MMLWKPGVLALGTFMIAGAVWCGFHELQAQRINTSHVGTKYIKTTKQDVTKHIEHRVKHDSKEHHTFHSVPKNPVTSTAIGNRRLDPMAGVWGPSRLRIINPYTSVSGTVESVIHEPSDADYHIDLRPDQTYRHLLNNINITQVNGDLVVEVIPLDSDRIPIPYVGEYVTVTGSYVRDTLHGWMEIHPAWLINGKGSASYTPVELARAMKEITDSYDSLVTRATITVVSTNLNVNPSETAQVIIKTAPEAAASLHVLSAAGRSMIHPLYSYAEDGGGIMFQWQIGKQFTPGTYQVIIQVYKHNALLYLTVQGAVTQTNETNATHT